MKCEEDVSVEWIGYVDGRLSAEERHRIEAHLAACGDCRARAEEFGNLWKALDETPAIEPSLGFDAQLRRRIAAEPRRPRLFSLVPQPRLALSLALLAAMTVLVAKLPLGNPTVETASAAVQRQDFNAINNLDVLENYDVVTELGALSDLAPAQAKGSESSGQQAARDNGGV